MKVLVATDGSEFSLIAARKAQMLLDPEVQLVLVTAVHRRTDPNEDATGFAAPILTEEEAEELHTAEVVEGHGALAVTARALGPDPFEQVVIEGDPGPAICELADEMGAALIVVGSHGRGFLSKVLLGSVSSYVVRHAPCAVMVIRRQEGD